MLAEVDADDDEDDADEEEEARVASDKSANVLRNIVVGFAVMMMTI